MKLHLSLELDVGLAARAEVNECEGAKCQPSGHGLPYNLMTSSPKIPAFLRFRPENMSGHVFTGAYIPWSPNKLAAFGSAL